MKERQSAAHLITGKSGEDLASNFLHSNGHEIIERNYRFKRAEIDIIAKKENLLLFIEVKTRSSSSHGHAETAVSERKIEMVMHAAEEYMRRQDWHGDIRFDVIAVEKTKAGWQIRHFEDAMH